MNHRIAARRPGKRLQHKTLGDPSRSLGLEWLENRWLLAGDVDDQISEAIGLTNVSTSEEGFFLHGSISQAADVDVYKVATWPGLTLDFDIDTVENGPSGLDSYLRLFDSKGKQLAFSDNAANPDEYYHGYDAFIRYIFTTSEYYYLGVSNAHNITYNPITGEGDRSIGTSLIGDYTVMMRMAGDTPDLADNAAKAVGFDHPKDNITLRGRIEHDTDVDVYVVTLHPKSTIDFDLDTFASEVGGLNPYMRVFHYNGLEVAPVKAGVAPGDTQVGNDPYLRYHFELGGTIYVGISHAGHTKYNIMNRVSTTPNGANSAGYYTLRINEVRDDWNDSYYWSESLRDVTTAPLVRESIVEVDLDVDIYNFVVVQGQTVDFDIDTPFNGIGSVDSFLRLFNGSQQLAANDGAVSPGEKSLGFDAYLRYTFDTPGTYYIGVSNKNNIQYDPLSDTGDTAGGLHSTGVYTLTITQSLITPIDIDDTLDKAQSYAIIVRRPPTETSGVIHQDIDVDMFSFDIEKDGQTAYIYVWHGIDLGFQLRLFDANGQPLAHSSGNPVSTTTNILRYTFEKAGKYYFGVSARNNIAYDPKSGTGDAQGAPTDVGGYRVYIAIVPVDTDDEIQEATRLPELTNDLSRKDGSLAIDVDVDLFRIEAMAGQIVDIDIDTEFNGKTLNTYLRVFSEDGIELASNNNGLAPGETAWYDTVDATDSYLRYTFETTGAYYIGISNATNKTYNALDGRGDTAGGDKNSGDYSLYVRSITLVNDDPDDSIAEAVSLQNVTQLPKTVNSNLNRNTDVDMFSFSVMAGQRVNFDIDTAFTGLSSHLRLFNATGVQLASNSRAAAPGETMSGADSFLQYTFPTAGTYYVGVSTSYNAAYDAITGADNPLNYGYSHGNYTLIVQMDGPPPVPELTLSFDTTSIPEINGVATGTIARSGFFLAESIVVNIVTTNNNSVTVPSAIAIPAGQASINFSIIGIHDLAQGTRTTSIVVSSAGLASVSKTMTVTDSDGPGHNGYLPTDTNADGRVSAMDALLIITHLNLTGGGPIVVTLEHFLDVNADGQITPMDALLVINRLNFLNSGEGEAAPSELNSAGCIHTFPHLPTIAPGPASNVAWPKNRRWLDSVDGFFGEVSRATG